MAVLLCMYNVRFPVSKWGLERTEEPKQYMHIAYTNYVIIYSISLILSLIMSNLSAQTTYPYEYFKSPFSIFRSSDRRILHACDEQITIKRTTQWICDGDDKERKR